MKPFNIFLIFSLVVITLGFIFFKDEFNKGKESSPQVSMDLANYLDYSESNLENSKKRGKTVLFFAATGWCVTCIALDKEIKERYNNLPEDVTILKVDFDNDKKMKAKYFVTMQHTLIILDEKGVEKDRWIGGNFDLLLSKLSS